MRRLLDSFGTPASDRTAEDKAAAHAFLTDHARAEG